MSKLLVVNYRITQLKLNHIHNIIHGQVPRYLKSDFSLNSSWHNTRSGPLPLHIPQIKFWTVFFHDTATSDWNNLSNNIKNITTKSVFKSHVKNSILVQLYALIIVLLTHLPFYSTLKQRNHLPSNILTIYFPSE